MVYLKSDRSDTMQKYVALNFEIYNKLVEKLGVFVFSYANWGLYSFSPLFKYVIAKTVEFLRKREEGTCENVWSDLSKYLKDTIDLLLKELKAGLQWKPTFQLYIIKDFIYTLQNFSYEALYARCLDRFVSFLRNFETRLSSKEKDTLYRRFFHINERKDSLEEIARDCGITKEKVRQIERRLNKS